MVWVRLAQKESGFFTSAYRLVDITWGENPASGEKSSLILPLYSVCSVSFFLADFRSFLLILGHVVPCMRFFVFLLWICLSSFDKSETKKSKSRYQAFLISFLIAVTNALQNSSKEEKGHFQIMIIESTCLGAVTMWNAMVVGTWGAACLMVVRKQKQNKGSGQGKIWHQWHTPSDLCPHTWPWSLLITTSQ